MTALRVLMLTSNHHATSNIQLAAQSAATHLLEDLAHHYCALFIKAIGCEASSSSRG
jgi:TorA maturation chaperone TorD